MTNQNRYFKTDKLILFSDIWKIKEKSKHEMHCNSCGDKYLGHSEWETNTITIAIDDTENTPEQILFHELGHIFGDYYGISKSEIFADAFANFFISIIKQMRYKQ